MKERAWLQRTRSLRRRARRCNGLSCGCGSWRTEGNMLVRNRSDGARSSKCQRRGHRRRSDRLVAESGLLLKDYGSHFEVVLEIVISKEVELCFIHRSIVLGAPRGRVTAGRAGALPARVTGRGHVRIQFKCWARGGISRRVVACLFAGRNISKSMMG